MIMSSKEILEMRAKDPENFYKEIKCENCPLNTMCDGCSCKSSLYHYLYQFAESEIAQNKLYTIDNGAESFVVELTPEQEKFLSWLDTHNFFCNSPKEYKQPNIYKI